MRASCFDTTLVQDAPNPLETSCDALGDPPPGSVVAGKYRVEARIAIGGMATILRAEHLGLGERVALKILLPRYRKSLEFVGRFGVEARSAARLRSEHVARVLDFGTLPDGSPYLAMELLDGHDLEARLLERGPLAETEAVDFVLQACEALAEAHALGIVHRDLKPQNLFVTKGADGAELVKVIDFGIAKSMRGRAGLTGKHASMGTPHYMSPEQLRAVDTVDARSDIWSMGVILHELLTCRNVFDAATVSELLVMVATSDPRLSLEPKHSDGLKAVIKKCLSTDREHRFRSTRELAEALVPFASASGGARVRRLRHIEEAARERATPLDVPPPSTPMREPASSLPTMAATQSLLYVREPKRRVLAAIAGLAVAGLLFGFAPRSRGEAPHAPARPAEVTVAAEVPPPSTFEPPPLPLVEDVRVSPPTAAAPPPNAAAAKRSAKADVRAPANAASARPPTSSNDRDRFFNTRK